MTNTAPNYAYGNMAVADGVDGHLKGLYVARFWRDNMDKPEPIALCNTRTDCELVSNALNLSIGLTGEQADDLLTAWMEADPHYL